MIDPCGPPTPPLCPLPAPAALWLHQTPQLTTPFNPPLACPSPPPHTPTAGGHPGPEGPRHRPPDPCGPGGRAPTPGRLRAGSGAQACLPAKPYPCPWLVVPEPHLVPRPTLGLGIWCLGLLGAPQTQTHTHTLISTLGAPQTHARISTLGAPQTNTHTLQRARLACRAQQGPQPPGLGPRHPPVPFPQSTPRRRTARWAMSHQTWSLPCWRPSLIPRSG